MCVDTMNCGGQCPECRDNVARLQRRHEGTLKMMATKAARSAAKKAVERVPRSANPYRVGSEMHRIWDEAWVHADAQLSKQD